MISLPPLHFPVELCALVLYHKHSQITIPGTLPLTEETFMNIKWVMNRMPKTEDAWLPVMAESEIKKVRAFHESFPQYERTPLVSLAHAAARLGPGGFLSRMKATASG